MTIKDETKALWKRCFEDSDAFTDLYFDQRYRDDINMTVCEEGQVIAALQMIPYPLWWGGEEVPVSYISGACTHPDYRSRGVMRRLLKDTHRQMYARGIYLSTLIPAEPGLFHYYAQSGYATCFHYTLRQVNLPEAPLPDYRVEVCASPTAAHYHYLDTCMRRRGNVLLHTKEDWEVVGADARLEDGRWLAVYLHEQLCGMALAVPEEGKVSLKECVADNEEARKALFHEAAYIYKVETVECITPSAPEDARPLGMARVIHAEKTLAVYAKLHPRQTLHLHVTGDEAIPENNGFYILQNGNCLHEETPSSAAPYEVYTMAGLARLLLETEHLYMSLMLN